MLCSLHRLLKTKGKNGAKSKKTLQSQHDMGQGSEEVGGGRYTESFKGRGDRSSRRTRSRRGRRSRMEGNVD